MAATPEDNKAEEQSFEWLYRTALESNRLPSVERVINFPAERMLSISLRGALSRFDGPQSYLGLDTFLAAIPIVSQDKAKEVAIHLFVNLIASSETYVPTAMMGTIEVHWILLGLFAHAEKICKKCEPDEQVISVRHFFLALAAHHNFFAPDFDEDKDPQHDDIITEILPDMFRLDVRDFQILYREERKWAKENPIDGTLRSIARATFYASRASDAAEIPEIDALGLRPDAKALAELICLKEPGPPLAIGLFGDWGAGKSTFMAMIEDEAAKTAELERKAFEEDSQRAPLFVQNVVQIRFNAWHYSEANLWSSLAAHIFRSLFEQSHSQTLPDNRRRPSWLAPEAFRDLLQDLAKQRAIGKQAEQTTTDARRALSEAEVAATKAKRLRDQLARVEAGDVGGVIALLKSPDGRAALQKALGESELPAELTDAIKIVDSADAIKSVPGRIATVLRATVSEWVLIWGSAVGVVTGAGILLAQDAGLDLPSLWAATTPAALGLGVAVLSGINRAGKAIASLDLFADTLNETSADAASTAEAALVDAQTNLDAAEVALDQARRRREGLEALADADNPEAALNAFLDARLGDGTYRDQLGVVSKLHDDFNALSELIRKSEREWEAKRDDAIEDDKPVKAPNHLQRIVLYIDDLDRCSDETVVKVLEAVHLLLALPLFAVVVGVDSRWLEGALGRVYKKQLGEGGSASPSDYMEKIFQLPYWLPKLDTTDTDSGSFAQLVDSLVPELAAETPDAAVPEGGDSVAGSGDDGAGGEVGGGDGDDDTPPAGRGGVVWIESERTAAEEREVIRQQVELTKDELDCIKALAPLIGKSPRAVKRFMNSYRFLKALGLIGEDQSVSTIAALGIGIGMGSDTHEIWRRADDFINICLSASNSLLAALDNAPEVLGQRDADLIAEFGNLFEDNHQQWQQDIKRIGDALKRLPEDQQASVHNALHSYESAHALTRLTFRRPY